MKLKILYTLLFILTINCKTENKQTTLTVEKHTTHINDTITKINEKIDTINPNKFIGKSYEYLKNSIEYQKYDYGTVGIHIDSYSEINYSLGNLRGKNNITRYIFFIRKNETDKIILDVLDFTNKENKVLKNEVLSTFFCYKDGKNDQEIIAIAEYDEYAEYLTKIHKAWRADRKTEKIIEIPTTGIKVENMDYGL